MNKKYAIGVGIAVIIGIAVAVYEFSSENIKGTNTGNSVGVSDNLQMQKTPANATGRHFTIQLNETFGVVAKP